jgi:MoaA/NifB/PqqE/SkfB family radical SAM enzyme
VGSGQKDLPLDLFKRTIPMARKLGCKCINISGGEPLLHPYWRDFIKMCKDANITPFLSTNGLLIKDLFQPELSDLSLLAIPLDGHCSAVNDKIRCPGHFEKVISLIEQYKKNDFPFILKINTVVRVDNYDFLEFILDIFGDHNRIIWKLFQSAPRGKFASSCVHSVSSNMILRKVGSFSKRKSTKCNIMYLLANSAGNYLIVDASGEIHVPAETCYKKIGSILDEAIIDFIFESKYLVGNTLKGQITGETYVEKKL